MLNGIKYTKIQSKNELLMYERNICTFVYLTFYCDRLTKRGTKNNFSS